MIEYEDYSNVSYPDVQPINNSTEIYDIAETHPMTYLLYVTLPTLAGDCLDDNNYY